jgi:hypothetical protein
VFCSDRCAAEGNRRRMKHNRRLTAESRRALGWMARVKILCGAFDCAAGDLLGLIEAQRGRKSGFGCRGSGSGVRG